MTLYVLRLVDNQDITQNETKSFSWKNTSDKVAIGTLFVLHAEFPYLKIIINQLPKALPNGPGDVDIHAHHYIRTPWGVIAER